MNDEQKAALAQLIGGDAVNQLLGHAEDVNKAVEAAGLRAKADAGPELATAPMVTAEPAPASPQGRMEPTLAEAIAAVRSVSDRLGQLETNLATLAGGLKALAEKQTALDDAPRRLNLYRASQDPATADAEFAAKNSGPGTRYPDAVEAIVNRMLAGNGS